MKLSNAFRLIFAGVALLSGCAASTDESSSSMGGDEVDSSQTGEVTSELISGNVELTAPAPDVEVISGAQSRITAHVKLTGLAPGATATLTYSLGRQAFRHLYRSQTEIRTVTLANGTTEITDSVSTLCSTTRLPYTWFITGTLTTSSGSVEIQGSRRGVRCD